jgi:glycogen synthase
MNKSTMKLKKKLSIAIIDMDNLRNPFWAAGQARATREVGKRLAEKHTVTVYSSKYPKYKNYIEDGIRYKHIGLVNNNSLLTNIAFIFSIPLAVRKIKADIIIENYNAPTSISFAPLFTKTPIIGLPTMFNAKEFTKKYHLPFHWIEQFGSKYYKYFLPYSHVDSQKMKQYNPNVIYKIVPQGVSKEFFAIPHKKPAYILFLGRFDIQQKGIDLLLHAYAKVKKTMGYPLVIAGRGPDEKKIHNLIKDLGLESQVTVLGPAYGETKARLIEKALFVAFPSRHDEISLWALEALASGMPLVGFDLPECTWVTNGVSLKAKPFSIADYAKQLVAATEPKLNRTMRKNARTLAKQYTWEKVAGMFEEFIYEVLEKEKVSRVSQVARVPRVNKQHKGFFARDTSGTRATV